eukprot:1145836-Pelagomonas_calceolata.AAC.6
MEMGSGTPSFRAVSTIRHTPAAQWWGTQQFPQGCMYTARDWLTLCPGRPPWTPQIGNSPAPPQGFNATVFEGCMEKTCLRFG